MKNHYVAHAINGDAVREIGSDTNKAELIRFCKSFVDSGWVVVVSTQCSTTTDTAKFFSWILVAGGNAKKESYHVQEVPMEKYFCDTCQQWHKGVPVFKVLISPKNLLWTCSIDKAVRMKNASIAQGHEPVLV